MYIIIKDKKVYKTSNKDIREEWYLTIEREDFTQEENKLLWFWAEINEKWEIIETYESKKNSLLSEESMLDFIFTIATVLNEVVPKDTDNPVLKAWIEKFNTIKEVLKWVN